MATKAEKHVQRSELMRTGPLGPTIIRMALPSIVSFLITSVYNLADTYFVSSLGTQATAAVSVNASLDMLIMMIGSLLGVGSGSLVARLLGAQNRQKADEVLSTNFAIAAVFGVVLMIFGSVFVHPLVRLLGATATCERYSVQYATYVLLAAPFMATSFVMNQCLRAEGSAMLSMIGMGFGGILNCFLDPLFIFKFGLGVAGASMATAISKLVSFCILVYPYLRGKSLLQLRFRFIRMDIKAIGEVLSIGSSSMFRTALTVLSGIVLNKLAGAISDSVLAGIGVCTKIMMFPFGFVIGFGQGFQPVAGFNWGAKQYDRVRESYRIAAKIAFFGSAVMGVLVCVFAPTLIGLFTQTDEEMLRIGALCLRLQGIALPIHAWVAIVNMLCVGIGKARGALALSTARQGTCFLPIVYPIAKLGGAYGIASVQAVADVLTLALAVPIKNRMLKIIGETAAEHKLSLEANTEEE